MLSKYVFVATLTLISFSFHICYSFTITTTSTSIITDISDEESSILPNFISKTQYSGTILMHLRFPLTISLVNNATYENQYEWYMDCISRNHTKKELYIFHNQWFQQNVQNWTEVLLHGNNLVGHALQNSNSNPIKALEIGSFEGASSVFTLENIVGKHPDSELYVIDTFQGSGAEHSHLEEVVSMLLQLYLHNIYVSGHSSHVRIIQGSSSIQLPKLVNYIRMLKQTSIDRGNGNGNGNVSVENCEYSTSSILMVPTEPVMC